MNSLRPDWVKQKFKDAVINRSHGNMRGQPTIRTTEAFSSLFESQLYSVSRSMFTSRMR